MTAWKDVIYESLLHSLVVITWYPSYLTLCDPFLHLFLQIPRSIKVSYPNIPEGSLGWRIYTKEFADDGTRE